MADVATLNAKTTKAKNPLNSFRSYNYIFTLASLKKTALTDPESYRINQDYFVIARSGGKGSTGIIPPTDANTSDITTIDGSVSDLVTSFNKNSPGRFDFYINNVSIDTVMGQNEKTSLSVATNIEFDLIEPYSMTGFIEALQVSAVAAGHDQYTNCPYLLKMEFVGYPDDQYLPDTAIPVPNSTRYFVLGFTSLDIEVTESGAKYHCKCVPFNEKGFGEPAVLKSNIQLVGNTVGEILSNFSNELNKMIQSDAKNTKGDTSANKCDQYEIVLPKVDETGIVAGSTDGSWDTCQGINLLKDPAVYKFEDPGVMANTATNTVHYDPKAPAIFFAENANIHECIVSIIRDSDYTKKLLKDFPNNVDPDTGFVNYFMVHLEMEDLGTVDSTTNKPFYKYRYVVIPYKMHYTRIPNSVVSGTVDTSKLSTMVNREYDYIYTGANVDILKFNLKFNTLFFQAIPAAMGNKKGMPSATSGIQTEGNTFPTLLGKPPGESQESSLGVQPVRAYPDFTQVNPKGIANSGQPQSDPFAALAKNLHQAILNNVDQCTADIEIIGDPFYLVTGSMGNYKPKINPDTKEAGEGEAPYTTQDVMVIVTFRNPSDIDLTTGEAIFDQATAPYSGVFRVIQVSSKFTDGEFKQTLSLVRLPAQLIDTNVPIKPRTPLVNTAPNAADAPTPVPPAPVSTLRADPNSLLSSITAGLPVAGLPGSLSQLVPSSISSLAGNLSLGNVTNLVTNAVAGTSGAVSSAAAGIVQWGKTAASAGVPNVTSDALASTALASGLGSASTIGTSAMSAATSLGSSAAGLISGVGAKISGITGGNANIAGDLGVDLSSLSGLSPNLQSKVAGALTDAIKTIPDGVDVNQAVKSGLILNNIPKSALANIPSTQPIAIAPLPSYNLTDIKAVLDRGGSLANIPGASSIPGVDKLLASSGINLPSGLGLDASSIAGKLSTAQAGLGSITGQSLSVEASIGNISSMVPSGLPDVSSISSSVVSKFGSVSANASSPLTTLMKSVS